MLMDDIRGFRESSGAARLAMIWCGSTEVFHRPAAVHQTLADFECGLQKNDPEISPSQIYAYAALKMGVPYANGAPHLTTDTPALLQLARERQVPIWSRAQLCSRAFLACVDYTRFRFEWRKRFAQGSPRFSPSAPGPQVIAALSPQIGRAHV